MNQKILYTLALLFATLQTFSQTTNTYEYDANNRLVKVTYSNGITVAYTYDALGNRTSKKVTGGSGGTEPTPTETIELVDLGLSVKWANMNIDATTSSAKGGYYAWGETATKSTYTWANYKHCSGTDESCNNIGTTIAKKKTYDRAYAYNTTMCLPTATQWNELISKCTWTAATVNSVKGYKVKGPSGKTIFLPFSGCSYDGSNYGSGEYGYYWSANNVSSDASKAQAAYVKASTKTTIANLNRRTGCAIRAVSVATTGTGDEPTTTIELVDLGLSVKWANMNIDATATSGKGGYYAWGETATKSTYTWANYKHCSGTDESCTNIGTTIAKKSSYDRAYAYKTTMCLPTATQWNELISKCTWTAATVNSVKGYNVKGPSGKTIFLSLSGCSYDGSNYGSGEYGYYWSANNVSSDVSKAQAAYVKASTKTTIANLNRRTGCAIRAVSVATTGTGDEPTTTIELVDLGLSVKWANMNIDATGTSGKGGYYAWGETATKSTYTWANYKHCSGTAASCTNIGTTIAKKSTYDRAYAYKTTMCLPTATQWNELISKCTWTAATVSNVKGYNVKGPSGKTIFLPLSGCSYDGSNYGSGEYGYYWSANNVSSDASKAQAAYVKASTKTTVANLNRRTGCAIRAVSVATTGTGDEPTTTIELVDLGLSVKWANMNIDATATSGKGGYYAWGETATKSTYTWANYKHCSGTASSCTNIGTTIAKKSSYDRAYAYKTTMCLPTATQWNELISKCTWTAATVNSVKGYNVKGPSGKTIFLPFSGCSYDGSNYGSGEYGYYWSANNVSSDASKAQAAYVKASTKTTVANLNRRTGCAIRAVSVATTGTTEDPTTTIELVDLGLSVKWANMNIDATASTGKGGYYAWGETFTKSMYSWDTYKYCSGTAASCTNIGTSIAKKSSYDRAYAYKTTMCLPTATQWNELISKCTWTAATVSNVKGYNVKGPSGKTIFLPFSGCSYDGSNYGSGEYGYYWSANNVSSDVSKAQAAYVKASTKTTVTNLNRRTGCAIRAVSVATTGTTEDPTTTIELVDLGLSVKWANMNIDATASTGKGGYYSWGETYTKSMYSWDTYKYCSGTASSCTDIGTSIAKKKTYDCAYAYKTTMCLPTAAQWDELITKCTWTETTVNNVKGYKVKGPSGKTIFLPFSGCSYDGSNYGSGEYGYYWSANNVSSDVSKAKAAYIKTGTKLSVANLNRRTGCAVRAVSVQ